MNQTRRIISILTALTCLLLYTLSPVYADETAGSTAGEPGEITSIEPADNSPVPAGDGTEAVQETTISDSALEEVPEAAEDESPDAEDPVPIEEITEPAAEIPDTSESVQLTQEEESGYDGSEVLNVAVPLTVSIVIDPFEISGKGQIYSDLYEITNFGDADVLLTFTDIQVTFADDTNFEALAKPFDDRTDSDLKSIYLLLNFGRDNITPVAITDPAREDDITIPLAGNQADANGNSFLSFYFSGSVNHLPEVGWKDGDVKISISYKLEVIPPPLKADVLMLTDPGEEIAEDNTTPEAVETTDTELPPASTEISPEESPSDLVDGLPKDGTVPDQPDMPSTTDSPEYEPPTVSPTQTPDSPESGPPAQMSDPPPGTNP